MMIATITSVPDTEGFGTVLVRDQTRPCYFSPLRFTNLAGSNWPSPLVADRVMVADSRGGLLALWLLGKGIPTAEAP